MSARQPVRRRRTARADAARASSTSLAEINVVPLVDVMLVLLIIFMVTAPMMQQGLQVNLPQARSATPVTAQPVYVTVPADFSRTPHRAARQGRRAHRFAAASACARRCLRATTSRCSSARTRAATVQDLATVMDELKEGGVEKVGLMTQAGRDGSACTKRSATFCIERAREADGIEPDGAVSSLGARVADRRRWSLMPAELAVGDRSPPSDADDDLARGGTGAGTGGMTPIAGTAGPGSRQAEAPRRRPTPPAPKPPEMVAPEPAAKPLPKTPRQADREAGRQVVDAQADDRRRR